MQQEAKAPQLSEDEIRAALRRKEVKDAIVSVLGEMVSAGDLIKFVGVYDKSGTPWAQDPYDEGWSIKKPEEQGPYYADFGLVAAPIMQHFPEMLIGGPGRRGAISRDVGQPEFILIRNEVENEGGGEPVTRHFGIAPLERKYAFFLVGLTWKERVSFNYHQFREELLHYRLRVSKLLKGEE